MQNKKIISITPAIRWEDALPTGNGSIGALVYGNICRDTIILNHDALWIPSLQSKPPDISENLPELREMLLGGEYGMTDRYFDLMFQDKKFVLEQSSASYHPAAELLIQTDSNIPFTDYHRTLDFTSGLITISWKEKQATFSRDVFVSRTHDLICIQIKGELPRDYHLILQPRTLFEENRAFGKNLTIDKIPIQFNARYETSQFFLSGKYNTGDFFCTGGKVSQCDGSIKIENNSLVLCAITSATIILKIQPPTSNSSHEEIQALVKKDLDHISNSFAVLFEEHSQNHRTLFDRVSFTLHSPNSTPISMKNLETMLLESYNGQIPLDFYETMFYFGRFLLICSSRPGGWPANLQGIWNGNYYPAWSSDYHNDENIQMNYWAALPGNLAETTHPYFDYYNACIPDCQRNAKVVYGAKGIMIPIAQTVKGQAPLYGGAWLNWTAGAGWISQLYYDYWLYTHDDHFLREQAVPYLKEVTLFYESFLFKGKNGKYIFCPSLSPENIPAIPNASLATINATMDIAVAKEVFQNLCDSCIYLGIESANIPKWQEMIKNLPDYEINQDGAMKEWLWPGLTDNYQHRHLSHIYGLFPGFEITDTFMPKIFQACKIAVEKRQVVGQMSQTGWSLAHMANIYARLHEGDRALTALNQMLRACVGPNLFTYHNDWRHQGLTLFWNFMDRIFQIDANFGITAAILEMLLYSNKDLIGILPALPSNWNSGEIVGVVARGAVVIDIKWQNDTTGKMNIHLKMQTQFDQTRIVKFSSKISHIEITSGEGVIEETSSGNSYRKIKLFTNKSLSISVILN